MPKQNCQSLVITVARNNVNLNCDVTYYDYMHTVCHNKYFTNHMYS